MFKICNDKTYYVVQTTSEDVVVEIYTKKDGRGSGISLHEMHLDLCRAVYAGIHPVCEMPRQRC